MFALGIVTEDLHITIAAEVRSLPQLIDRIAGVAEGQRISNFLPISGHAPGTPWARLDFIIFMQLSSQKVPDRRSPGGKKLGLTPLTGRSPGGNKSPQITSLVGQASLAWTISSPLGGQRHHSA